MIRGFVNKEVKNYNYVSDIFELESIIDENTNISILERLVPYEIKDFLINLLEIGFSPINKSIKVSGFEEIFDTHLKIYQSISPRGYRALKEDILELITTFSRISDSKSVKLFFGIVKTDMCRRFHTDMYDMRMISSYHGKGTEWLTHDNVNFNAFDSLEGNDKIVKRNKAIKRLNEGDVAIMKGALYPNSKFGGVVHKSPEIESLNQKRIILRVDSASLLDSILE